MGIFGFGNKEVLYFPGCFSEAFTDNIVENYERILKKIKLSFSKDSKFVCCGGILSEAGYEKQLRKLAKENYSYLQGRGVKKIITICPRCQITLKNYKDFVPEYEIETEFILPIILNVLNQDIDLIKNYIKEEVYYYDSCYLSRSLKIKDAPRDILKLLGYKVLELTKTREETQCCGNCGLLPQTNPELSKEICLDFIKTLKQRNIKKLITADILAFKFLKDVQAEFKIQDLEILEFSEIICNALGIKISN